MKNETNEKKKIKLEFEVNWRPNLFDLVIIVLGVAVMAAIILVMRFSNATLGETVSMEYVIELQNLPEGTWENVQIGDTITDNVWNMELGTVVSVSTEPQTRSMGDTAGTHVYQSEVPGYENILIRLRSNMTDSESELATTSGFTLRVGTSVSAVGPCYAGSGYVTIIDLDSVGEPDK
jgi:hypothetical protein